MFGNYNTVDAHIYETRRDSYNVFVKSKVRKWK